MFGLDNELVEIDLIAKIAIEVSNEVKKIQRNCLFVDKKNNEEYEKAYLSYLRVSSLTNYKNRKQELKEFCDKMISEEEQFIVLKKNAGAYQENIKFPMNYRKMLNGLLLNQINVTPGTLLRVHANSCVNPDIVEDDDNDED
jgi:hypothetical protein